MNKNKMLKYGILVFLTLLVSSIGVFAGWDYEIGGGGGGFVSPATENLDMDGYTIIGVATIDTGQGANEVYDMDQNVLTTSTPTFVAINTGNGACEVYGQDTFTYNVLVDSATTNYLGALVLPAPSFAYAITISSITFCTDAGTVTGVDCNWVSEATPFSAGTDILTGTISVGTGAKYGASGFADATIPSASVIRIISSGTSGTPTKFWGRFTYTIDR